MVINLTLGIWCRTMIYTRSMERLLMTNVPDIFVSNGKPLSSY